MTTVCVDASFALKGVLREPQHEQVQEHFRLWRAQDVELIAPWLLLFETHSVLHRKVFQGILNDAEARAAWRVLLRLGIKTAHPRGLFDRAWVLADRLSRPVTYDAAYAAVAEIRGCELWTADQRLINAAAGKINWIRSVGAV